MSHRLRDAMHTALGLAAVVGAGIACALVYEALSGLWSPERSTVGNLGYLTGYVGTLALTLAAVVVTALIIRTIWRRSRR